MIEDGWAIVAVDRFSKPITPVRRGGWHRIGSRPTVNVAPSTNRVTVLGAVTDDGWSFYCWTEEYLTADHGIRPIGALEELREPDIVNYMLPKSPGSD